MIITLLLQTTPQNPPYAIYATLAVGVLSLIASSLNIYFSSRTAQKVVNLSTKTTREVAELSAQVSRESAGLAAQTAREIKEQDYKNDFYKKIIERRFKAWGEAERLISLLIDSKVDKDGASFPVYFENYEKFTEVLTIMRNIVPHSIWLNREFGRSLRDFHVRLVSIEKDCRIENEKGIELIDKKLLLEAGKKYQEECLLLLNGVIKSLASVVADMHDIKAFLKEFLKIAIVTLNP